MTSFLLLLSLLVQAPAGLKGQTGVVTGALRTNTGLPVEGVRVAVVPANQSIADSVLESLGLTDNTGRYRLENVSPGRYYILVDRRGQSTYHPGVIDLGQATVIQVLAGSTIEVAAMVLDRKPVSGRVVDLATGRGRRIENLILCCDYSQSLLMASPRAVVEAGTFTATISDDGSFVFPPVPPGNYSLTAADSSVIPTQWVLAVGKDGVAGLQLAVSEGVEVQGTVLDQAGEPARASVRLRRKLTSSVFNTIGPPTNTFTSTPVLFPKGDSSPDAIFERILKVAREHSGTLGPDGRFVFHKVYPGTYVLETTGGTSHLERELQVGVDSMANVSLQLAAINVAGRVVAPSGAPLPKLNYIRLIRSGADTEVFYGFPDTEGRFSLLLIPGSYQVFTDRLGRSVQSISDGSRNITNAEFTVENRRNQQIVVTLEP